MSIYSLTPEAEQQRLRLIHYPVWSMLLEPAECESCRVYWRDCRVFGVRG